MQLAQMEAEIALQGNVEEAAEWELMTEDAKRDTIIKCHQVMGADLAKVMKESITQVQSREETERFE